MNRDPRRVWLSRIAVVGKQVPVRFARPASGKRKNVKLKLRSYPAASRFWTVGAHPCKLANHPHALARRLRRGLEFATGVPASDPFRQVSLA